MELAPAIAKLEERMRVALRQQAAMHVVERTVLLRAVGRVSAACNVLPWRAAHMLLGRRGKEASIAGGQTHCGPLSAAADWLCKEDAANTEKAAAGCGRQADVHTAVLLPCLCHAQGVPQAMLQVRT